MNWFPPCRIVAHKHMACQQQGLTPALRALLTHHALICLVAINGPMSILWTQKVEHFLSA